MILFPELTETGNLVELKNMLFELGKLLKLFDELCLNQSVSLNTTLK